MRRQGAALLLAASTVACATVNYLDSEGPRYLYPLAEASPQSAGTPLRVVSFNIAYGRQIDRALEVLRESGPLRSPDILALQEMDGRGTEQIAKALGMNAVYFPSGVHPKDDRDFGCAILSPWPLEDPRKLLLPHGARITGLRRAAVVATVVRGSERVRVYSVHLPSPLGISGGSRLDQLRVLAADAVTADIPVVIAGDFNSHNKVAELERAGFDWVTRDVGHTVRFRLLGIPLAGMSYDHVLARGLGLARDADSVGVVSDTRGASDHRPVWALLVAEEAAAARIASRGSPSGRR